MLHSQMSVKAVGYLSRTPDYRCITNKTFSEESTNSAHSVDYKRQIIGHSLYKE